jgi:hypothetical protein
LDRALWDGSGASCSLRLPFTESVVLAAAEVLIYASLGGLRGTIYKEVFQRLVIVLGLAPLLNRTATVFNSVGPDRTRWSCDGRPAGRFRRVRSEILGKRVWAGLAHARQNGKQLGRPATAILHADRVRKLRRFGPSKSETVRSIRAARPEQ